MNRVITQTEIARRSGIDKGSISKYLSGRKVPTLKTVLRIIRSTGLPIEIFTSADMQKAYFGKAYLRDEKLYEEREK
ncbi:helix-turn-helix domain-containing protein [Hydrogenimonas sp.]